MSRAPMKKMIQATAVAALVVVSLAGCVRMHSTTTVHSDNTVDQHVLMAIDVEAFSELGDDSATPKADDFLNGLPEDLADRTTVSDYKDGAYEGFEATIKGLTLEEINSGITDAGGEELGVGTSGATLVREGDEFVLTLPVEPNTEEGSPADYADYFDIKVVYEFPGEIALATGGTVEGNTVTFTTADLYGDDDIIVRAAATSGEFPWLILIIFLVVSLLIIAGIIGLVIWLVVRGKKNAAAPVAAPAAPGVVPPAPAPAAPAAPPAAPADATPPPPAPPAPPAPPQA